MPRVTLQTVADHLSLSRSAISRGLSRDPSIPPTTGKRIRAACRALGYRPDPLLSELASARWRKDQAPGGSVIGYIGELHLHGDPYPGLHEMVSAEAAVLGYGVDVFDPTTFSSPVQLQRALRNRGITELILGPAISGSLPVHLDWSKFICVQLLPGFTPLPLHSVVRDHFNAVTLAWRKAVSYGYRRIGVTLLEHPHRVIDDVMRASAVYACQRHLFPELPVIPPFIFAPLDYRSRAFARWIKFHRLDVIIGFNETHFYHFRNEFGHEMPFATLHSSKGSVSGVALNIDTSAREAIVLLHSCRRTYQWGVPKDRIDHVLEPNWFEGVTMPRKRPA